VKAEMKHLLLTGAGFSRSWGGWLASEAFEYLLGSIYIDDPLRAKLWQTKERGGGFEDTLFELQTAHAQQTHGLPEQQLRAMTNAVMAMFAEMAVGFAKSPFDDRDRFPIKDFLAKFDVIYTLNQDTLLEHHYIGPRWGEHHAGSVLPGIRSKGVDLDIGQNRYAMFEPDPAIFKMPDDHQPYIKLHGSFNWLQNEGSLLILGGNKAANIRTFPVLEWYHQMFRDDLESEDVRLMVIGYSFNDPHINDAITTAIAKARNMKVFIIDPNGVDVLDKRNKIPQPHSEAVLLEAISPRVIGASRRSIRSVFADDHVEQAKILRFFKF
jgi:hypothetical protein